MNVAKFILELQKLDQSKEVKVQMSDGRDVWLEDLWVDEDNMTDFVIVGGDEEHG